MKTLLTITLLLLTTVIYIQYQDIKALEDIICEDRQTWASHGRVGAIKTNCGLIINKNI